MTGTGPSTPWQTAFCGPIRQLIRVAEDESKRHTQLRCLSCSLLMMYRYTYVNTHTCINTYTYILTTNTYAYIHTYYTHTHICTHIFTHACAHTYTHTHAHTHTYIHTRTYICAHTHTHTHNAVTLIFMCIYMYIIHTIHIQHDAHTYYK